MLYRSIRLFVLSVCLLSLALPLFAQQERNAEGQVEARFKQFDKDGDGKLSPAEFPNAKLFAQLDKDADGFLSLEEAAPRLGNGARQAAPTPEERFTTLDKNVDGKLTPEELPNPALFKRLDTNNDGVVTLEEMRVNAAGPQPADPRSPENRFKQMDKNGDGNLSAEEFPNAVQFKQLDANKDGLLSLEEARDALRKGVVAEPKQSFTPLTELGENLYQGFNGGLYPDGANTPSHDYLQQGLAAAGKIAPLDYEGNPSGKGKIVLLSIGMSNTSQEYSFFKPLADADGDKNPALVIVNGAQSGQTAVIIRNPEAQFWEIVDKNLSKQQVNAAQVQVVWLKEANAREQRPFPQDARGLQDDLAAILQILPARYPNLKMIYLSSRTYAGYATTPLNPEPYAYQSGFAVKRKICSFFY